MTGGVGGPLLGRPRRLRNRRRRLRALGRRRSTPDQLVIGVDAVVENLRVQARKLAGKPARGGLPNALLGRLALADAPGALEGLADRLTVLLPWGALLAAVARPDAGGSGRAARDLPGRRRCPDRVRVRTGGGRNAGEGAGAAGDRRRRARGARRALPRRGVRRPRALCERRGGPRAADHLGQAARVLGTAAAVRRGDGRAV